MIFLLIRAKIINTKYKKVFDNVYKNTSPTPKYELRSSYGYPSFTITFDSVESLIGAEEEGLNHSFLKDIQELCKDMGSKDNPFNSEKAVFFTTDEYLGNLKTQFKKSE